MTGYTPGLDWSRMSEDRRGCHDVDDEPITVRCEGCSEHFPVESITTIAGLPWCTGCANCVECSQAATCLNHEGNLSCETCRTRMEVV